MWMVWMAKAVGPVHEEGAILRQVRAPGSEAVNVRVRLTSTQTMPALVQLYLWAREVLGDRSSHRVWAAASVRAVRHHSQENGRDTEGSALRWLVVRSQPEPPG